MTARFPQPLRAGDTIGITAFSSSVDTRLQPRLDHVLAHLKARGYRVEEGQYVREGWPSIAAARGASASALERAAELNELLHDPRVKAIAPPWGGELAIQVLPFIDFARLATLEPKWVFGFSDVSTLMMPLTLCSDWATLHCSNLMDLSSAQKDPLTSAVFDVLSATADQELVQRASELWQRDYADCVKDPSAGFNLTEPTEWKLLHPSSFEGKSAVHATGAPLTIEGRLIGGCLDTLRHLVGTPYGDVPNYIARNRARGEGTLLYLENCEMAPFDLARTLFGLRLAGWLNGLSGLMLGRSSGPEPSSAHEPFTYLDALHQSLGDLPYPVLYDLDIGHRQPQLCLINGARARVVYAQGTGTMTQVLS